MIKLLTDIKKASLIIALAFASLSAAAQSGEFKAFKLDLALGYAKPLGSPSSTDSTNTVSGGILIAVESKYAISNKISLGLRFETSLSASANVSSDTSATLMGTQGVKSATSFLITGDYYLTSGVIRPFVGGGAGLFLTGSLSGTSVDSTMTNADGDAGIKLGFVPRAGFELAHFRAAVEYNLVGKSNNTNYSYVGFKVGFFFGGGRLESDNGGSRGGGNRRSPNNRGDVSPR